MPPGNGPKAPSRPTVKRLFAVSGNLCAFAKCSTPLVDPRSGSIVGEICHIKGDKPDAPRYDANQTNEERQGFDNLILLCNIHHKVVDDDEIAYTNERLIQMKQDHESRHTSPPSVDDLTVEHFINVAIESSVQGSVVSSYGQSGGQTAHSITNVYGASATEEPLRLDGKLDMAGDLALVKQMGCPGMRLTVICRSTRPAKIQSAIMLIEGVNLMASLQQGFGTDFGYTPLQGSKETFAAELIPISPRNAAEGFVLNKDDVARFFYPLPLPSTTLALRARPEDVSIIVQLFDDSEWILLSGEDVQKTLETVFTVHHKQPGKLTQPMMFNVRIRSTTPPDVSAMGTVNEHYIPFAEREEAPPTPDLETS